jgi:glycosyltransferase involved in cell wall biosynthesis
MDSDQYNSRNAARPLVSICTVTCNRPRHLLLLQDCIKSQAYPHSLLEWIVLDDSSNQVNRFKAGKDLDISVTHIHAPSRMRLGKKRNQSHLYCLGEIIVYMDDDDWYPPARVEHAVRAFWKGRP